MKKLKDKDLISIHNLSVEEIKVIFQQARKFKKSRKNLDLLKGKSLALIFEKPAMRTRVSFEVGMVQLGGRAIELDPVAMEFGKRESIPDTARILSRYVDGIVLRTFGHERLVELAKYATIPVINGLTDLLHPCQALTDLYTITEKKKNLTGIKLAFVGDGNNVCHSLMFACAKLGLKMQIANPEGYAPDPEVTELALQDAQKSGGSIKLTHNPQEAVHNSDIVYTDVWASMGQEAEAEKRKKLFRPYQVNSNLLKAAKKDVLVMHCLPAHRGEEITDEVIDGPHSIVFDQAENRLHVQKALLAMLLA